MNKEKIFKILIILLLIIVAVLIIGTIYGLNLGEARVNISTLPINYDQAQVFSGIGQIRVPTADPEPEIVIIYLAFYYNPGDRAFSEELVLRIRDFKDIITEYIGSLLAEDLHENNEDKIKNELLRSFNSILRLGQIEELFFRDFMILR